MSNIFDLVCGFIHLTKYRFPTATFPIWYSPIWQEFFFDLKKNLSPNFPELENIIGVFEQDNGPRNKILEVILKLLVDHEILRINKVGRMYLDGTVTHDLPIPLFEEMFKIAETHEGLLEYD